MKYFTRSKYYRRDLTFNVTRKFKLYVMFKTFTDELWLTV